MILDITPKAIKRMNKMLLNASSSQLIKLENVGYSWQGPLWAIVLDEQKKDDMIIESDNIKILINKKLAAMSKKFDIDLRFTLFGFRYYVVQS